MQVAGRAEQSTVAITFRLKYYSLYRKESLCRKLALWGWWSLNKCPCHPNECIALIIMCRWKKWPGAVSHPSNALGILEMATNWALLLPNFSIRCLNMSDKRWKARCGIPASIYTQHHSLLARLLSFFPRNWTRNQGRRIIYVCSDDLSLDGTGEERNEKPKCLMQERRLPHAEE